MIEISLVQLILFKVNEERRKMTIMRAGDQCIFFLFPKIRTKLPEIITAKIDAP